MCYVTGMYVTVLFLCFGYVKMPEASVQGTQRSESGKAAQPPHAWALYQEQITMAHGESSQEVKQQQPSGQAGKQQPYTPQADREREGLLTSSPLVRPRSPSASQKDGTKTQALHFHYIFRMNIINHLLQSGCDVRFL